MEKNRLAVLQADIREQANLIDEVYYQITARKKNYTKNKQALESLGYQLHNLYCAFEDLFRIVADHFENHITEPRGWHTELLTRMKTPINGIRPALISSSTFELLDELLRFRHVFRHAYGIKLDPQKVKIVLQKALALKKIYKRDLNRFLARLKNRR